MPNLIGTAPNQVPTNGALGNMAFQNKEAVSVDTLVTTGNVGINATPQAWGANFKGIEGYGNSTFFLSGNSVNGITTVGNAYQNGTNWVYTTTGAAARYQVGTSVAPHIWSYAASGTGGTALTWAEGMRLDASGNLGVGVTPSAWDTFKVLQVGNGAIASPLFSNTIVTANAYYGSGSLRYIASSSPASVFQQADGIFYWRTAPSGTAGNAISFTQAMTLDASGNLGVGTGTPGYRLDVSQSGSAGAVIDVARIFANAGSTATPRLLFGSGANEVSAAIGAQTTTATTGDLTFYTETAGALTEKARIDSSGNVGIGTSSPGAKLDAIGVIRSKNASGDVGGLRLWSDVSGNGNIFEYYNASLIFGTGDTERARIDSSGNVGIGTSSPGQRLDVVSAANSATAYTALFRSTGAAGYSGLIGMGVNPTAAGAYTAAAFGAENVNGTANDGGILKILTATANSSHTLTERARIDSSGNVGIGTTSPTALLDVNADTVRVRTAKTPASATATGNAGDICWDSNYVYVCVATNTWKRSALSTW